MKKMLLFSLVGAVIIFAWQFLSHAFPNFHKSGSKYTASQAEILQKLQEMNLQEGMYLLGQPDPSKSQEECEKEWKNFENKPWAVINYQMNNNMDMAMPMIRSFIVDFIVAWLLFWMFLQQKDPTLKNRMLLSLAVGMISFFFLSYTQFIWFKNPDIFAYFFDGIVPWTILGFIGHKMA